MVTFAAGTGVRQGECFGLTVDRIDMLRREVTIDRQLVSVGGTGTDFGPPKTPASVRTIPLPQVVVDALAAHLARTRSGEDGLVFTLDGRPDHPAGGSDTSGGPWLEGRRSAAGTGIHALRHYYASLLIRHGESVKTVQARLGHASAAETLDTYSHLWPDSDDRPARPSTGAREQSRTVTDSCGLLRTADNHVSAGQRGWCGRAGL